MPAGDRQRSSQLEDDVSDSSPRPKKRRRSSTQTAASKPSADRSSSSISPMTASDAAGAAPGENFAATSKPKRVRTGCLTCRERHLKCDEGLPNCQNCRKSSRVCKRGVRLNFIDTTVQSPPMIPPTADWAVQFQDESREIASEYKGGLSRYAVLDQIITPPLEAGLEFHNRNMSIDPTIAMQTSIPVAVNPGAPGLYPESRGGMAKNELSRQNSHHSHQSHQSHQSHHSHTMSSAEMSSYLPTAPPTAYGNTEQTLTPPSEPRDYLSTAEEVLYMQVFVEEVGLWMDSMDPLKHFSRLLPFHSLGEPMLLNAFLACGAKHLTLVNPATYKEDRALYYYDTATTQLLRALQNPDRDTIICATSAVILNVYEIMSERALQRMNHIAGARALIKECGWNARSTGIGAACFWLNIGMELLSCLHFNWQVAWDPDQWGLDMDFQRETQVGREELWVYRMLYITAKIANFRASIPRFQEPSPQDEQSRLRRRYAEYKELRNLCDNWNSSIPRTMHPLACLYPHQQSTTKSCFPEVWLIKRATITGRLFYHTAMVLLAQINPLMDVTNEEMRTLCLSHAHYICGIVAHVKDRGVASVALRSMAIAAEVLVSRREQEEVLQVFERVQKQTGWNIGFLYKELPVKWRAAEEEALRQQQASMGQFFPPSAGPSLGGLPPAMPQGMRGGILNPLLKTADFSLPNHPYQAYYQPPNQHHNGNFSPGYF